MSINMVKPEIDNINLENVSKEIDQLKTLSFEISNTSNVIEESKAYKNRAFVIELHLVTTPVKSLSNARIFS